MTISFNQDQRIAITRRMVKIPLENNAFQSSKDTLDSASSIFAEVDSAHKVYFDHFLGIATQYEAEKQALNGEIAFTFDENDVLDAAQAKDGNLFWPNTAPFNPFLIPQINQYVNGDSSGTASNYESETLDDLARWIEFIKNGNSDPGSATLTSPYAPGDGVLVVDSASGFNVGDYVLAHDSVGSDGLFRIDNISSGLEVTEIVTPAATLAATTTSVSGTFSGYTNTQRQNLSGSSTDNTLTGLADIIKNDVTTWDSLLSTEETALSANEDDRATQASQINAAIADINNAQPVISTWQSKSDTGSDGKFIDSNIDPLKSEVDDRIVFVSNRIAEVNTALGQVTDGGDGTFSGTEGDIYFERYQWLNRRINRLYGSLSRESQASRGGVSVQNQIDNNSELLDEYDDFFVATRIDQDSDGSKTFEVQDISGFSVGDSVFLVDEENSEITRTLINISGQNFVFDEEVSEAYKKVNLFRVYKSL